MSSTALISVQELCMFDSTWKYFDKCIGNIEEIVAIP